MTKQVPATPLKRKTDDNDGDFGTKRVRAESPESDEVDQFISSAENVSLNCIESLKF